MVITPHSLFAAATTNKKSSLTKSFMFGFVTHFLLDKIPHTDYNIKMFKGKALVSDFLSALLLLFFFKTNKAQKAAALGGIVPDILQVAERTTGVHVTLDFHERNHTKIFPSIKTGVFTQVVTVVLSGFLLWFKNRK